MRPSHTAPLALALLTLAMPGCTWVSPDDRDVAIACLDEDGDGAIRNPFLCDGSSDPPDCDDTDPARSPFFEEIPYDGIDNDCSGFDLVDADGDGFPGILEEDWEPQHDGLQWPDGVVTDQLDCDDDDDEIYPGSPHEVPYDGIHHDCDFERDDFDLDGDGYIPEAYFAAYEAYLERYPELPDARVEGCRSAAPDPALCNDCDDDDPDVNPGTSLPNEWYDGVDQDCSGKNIFDQDGDGYIHEDHFGAYLAYIEHYGYEDTRPEPCRGENPDPADCSDCNDDPSTDDGPGRTAADTYPNAPEIPYDGWDQNCDGTDLVDVDGDGYPGILEEDWVATGPDVIYPPGLPQRWDCEDEDPSVFPTALEIVGDGVDRDCDGDPDTAPFAFGGYTWEDPRPPRVTVTPEAFILSMAGKAFLDPSGERHEVVVGSPHLDHLGVFFTLDRPQPAARFDGSYSFIAGQHEWAGKGTNQVLGFGIGAATDTDNDGRTLLYQGTSIVAGSAGTQLTLAPHNWSTNQENFVPASGVNWTSGTESFIDPYHSFDTWIDPDGRVWLLGCGVESLHYLLVDPSGSPSIVASGFQGGVGLGGDACFLEPREADLPLAHTLWFDGVDPRHDQWTLSDTGDDIEPYTGAAPWLEIIADTVSRRGDLVVVAGPDGLTYGDAEETSIALAGESVLAADGVRVGEHVYLAAIVEADGERDVVLLRPDGASEGNLVQSLLAFSHPDLEDIEPTDVSLVFDEDRVLVAVGAMEPLAPLDNDDSPMGAIGWVFLGHTPPE